MPKPSATTSSPSHSNRLRNISVSNSRSGAAMSARAPPARLLSLPLIKVSFKIKLIDAQSDGRQSPLLHPCFEVAHPVTWHEKQASERQWAWHSGSAAPPGDPEDGREKRIKATTHFRWRKAVVYQAADGLFNIQTMQKSSTSLQLSYVLKPWIYPIHSLINM